MFLDNPLVFQRFASCSYGEYHRFNRAQQRALFLEGLAKGGALASPDELTYFRSGCELDSQEEWNIYNGLSGFFISSPLLAEHRLFGTYHGLSMIKEGLLQIIVSTLNVLWHLYHTAASTIKLGFSIIGLVATLGLSSDARDFFANSVKSLFVHLTKTCVTSLLLISGVIGALITRPLSTLFNLLTNLDEESEQLEEKVEMAMEDILCDDRNRIENAMQWVNEQATVRGFGSRLERVVGSLSDVVSELPSLATTGITYRCSC